MGLFENIKQIASDKGIFLIDLEIKAQISENSIYTWKSINPGIDKVKRVADVLNVSIDELLKETNLENPDRNNCIQRCRR